MDFLNASAREHMAGRGRKNSKLKSIFIDKQVQTDFNKLSPLTLYL
jgi:hypothetical protein